MNLRKLILPLAILAGLLVAGYLAFRSPEKTQAKELFYTVQPGDFPVQVMATGELDSRQSVKVRGPQGMRAAGIYETTLSDIVAEGTILKKGDYVATLDRTELANKLTGIRTELETTQTQLEQAKIDTAIELRTLRDDLINTEFSLEEKELQVELNRFEAESIIRQTQLDLEKTRRDFAQLKKNYQLKQQQAEAKIREINTLMRQNQTELDRLLELSDGFRITAPDNGMLIYARTYGGKKEPGSRITAWDPVVAELPDLNDMISKTYVNEVDISKVRQGQPVEVRIDAFPDRQYSGRVIKVANIGEQVRGYDAKVFEVIVQVNETDSVMRPAMTTSNEILTETYQDVVSVPLEALYADSLSFVYKKDNNRIVRQEVLVGTANSDAIMIEHGIQPGDEVLISLPDNSRDYTFVPVDQEIKEAIRKKQEEDRKQRQAEARKRQEAVKDIDVQTSDGGGGGGRIFIMN